MPASPESLDSRHLIEALLQALNDHDPERAAACFAHDFEGTDVAQVGAQRGRKEVRRSLDRYLTAFPDLRIYEDDVLFDGGRAALLWSARATHSAPIMHIPPTGRIVTVRGVTFFTIRDGQIRRGTSIWDVAGFLRGIGLLPDLHQEASSCAP